MTRLIVLLYLAAIVAANWSISYWGPQAAVYNAFVFIGLDLVARDRLHDAWRGSWLWPRMAALIAAGGALSWLGAIAFDLQGPPGVTTGEIAIASFIAFSLAATVDALAYQLTRHWQWFQRSNLSNMAGAGADSVAFQTIAFGWSFPFIFAQFCAKIAGGLVWSFVLQPVLQRHVVVAPPMGPTERLRLQAWGQPPSGPRSDYP